MSRTIKKILLSREFLLLVILAIVLMIFHSRSEFFLTPQNLKGIIFNISVYSIIGVGMTILFISGGFDISAGTHLAFLGVTLGILLKNGVPVYFSILIVFCIAIIDGLLIGILIKKLNINAFVATLGAMFIFNGAAILITWVARPEVKGGPSSTSFSGLPESFLAIGGNTFLNIEYINYYALGVIIIFIVLLTKNVFFRQNYFIGGNERSARLAGIKVDRIYIFNFVLLSFLIALASILRVSRLGTASAHAGGESLSLTIVAAVILGGASLDGGKGSILGTLLGVSLVVFVNNGMTMLNINPLYSQVFVGFLLLGSILIDHISKTKLTFRRSIVN